MTAILFHVIMGAGQKVLAVLQGIQTLTAKVVYFLAKAVSPQQSQYYESLLDQQHSLSELAIMQRMVEIKEQAVAEEDWDDEQIIELNHLANTLHRLHGWQQETIDGYVSQLIASGPEGYSYGDPGTLED